MLKAKTEDLRNEDWSDKNWVLKWNITAKDVKA